MSPPKDPNLPRGTAQAITTSKQVSVRINTRPLPHNVTEFLIENIASIKRLYSERRGSDEATVLAEKDFAVDLEPDSEKKSKILSLTEFKAGLGKAFESAGQEVWTGVIEKIAAFGPRRIGPNLLIDATGKGLCRKL